MILNGEMSEWSIEHAWKLIPPRVLTHTKSTNAFPINDFRNNDLHRRVLVNTVVHRGFGGYVTQF